MNPEQRKNHEYLGDGVYIEHGDQEIILRTGSHEDHFCNNKIHLEVDIMKKMISWLIIRKVIEEQPTTLMRVADRADWNKAKKETVEITDDLINWIEYQQGLVIRLLKYINNDSETHGDILALLQDSRRCLEILEEDLKSRQTRPSFFIPLNP